jgi:hypothetical protein
VVERRKEGGNVKYKVHRLDVRMDEIDTLEAFLNALDGDVVAIVSNVTMKAWKTTDIDFLLVVEKVA